MDKNNLIPLIAENEAEQFESDREWQLAIKWNAIGGFIMSIIILVVVFFWYVDTTVDCIENGHSSNYSEGIQYDFQACTIEFRHKENVQPVRFEDDWIIE